MDGHMVLVNLKVNKTLRLTSLSPGLKREEERKQQQEEVAGVLWQLLLWAVRRSKLRHWKPARHTKRGCIFSFCRRKYKTVWNQNIANFQETLGGKRQLCFVRISRQEEECILLWFFFSKHGFEVDKGKWAHLPVEIKFHSYNWLAKTPSSSY